MTDNYVKWFQERFRYSRDRERVKCFTCRGSGNYEGQICPDCGSTGIIPEKQRSHSILCLQCSYPLVPSGIIYHVDDGLDGATRGSIAWCPNCHQPDLEGYIADDI